MLEKRRSPQLNIVVTGPQTVPLSYCQFGTYLSFLKFFIPLIVVLFCFFYVVQDVVVHLKEIFQH